MSRQTEQKLKSLLQAVPPGFLVDSAWLGRHGIARQSASDYVKAGWLERVAHGVYRRPFAPDENAEAVTGWKIPVLSAQWLMGHPFHLGGLSALELRGHVHYLALGGQPTVYLYGEAPDWLLKLPVDANLIRRSTVLFADKQLGIDNTDFDLSEEQLGLSPWRWPLRMATPERAILEALDELPHHQSFHTIGTVFEGLVNLRPRQMMALLKDCRSVKVKRLFFVYADKHGHAWRRHLDETALDLGRGDRALARDGRLHPAYRITVPADLMPQKGASDGP